MNLVFAQPGGVVTGSVVYCKLRGDFPDLVGRAPEQSGSAT